MSTKWIDNMNLNCAVKLLRCDDLPISNSEDVVSVADKQANTEVKRSVRISRKRTKHILENGNQSDNVKKRNYMIKKPKLNKIEPGKTDAYQKEIVNAKIQDSSVKSTDSYLINDDLSVTSGSTLCPNNFINNKEKISKQKIVKPKPIKFKISKSIIAVRKKPIVHDVDKNNPSNETKTPKPISSNRKKPEPNNVGKNNTSELEESNSVISIKTPKNKTPKSNTSNKKKSLNNVLTNVELQHELEINDNFAVPQVPKSKTSKSIVSNRKKPAVNNINQSDLTNEHETSNTGKIPRKRCRTSLKKEKCQNPDFGGIIICNTEDSLDQAQNLGIICKTPYSDEDLKLSQNFDDTNQLRSNDKPQNDNILITYNIPLDESTPLVCNDALSEPVGICNAPSSGTSSNFSIIHTTGTESTFSTINDQQSHLSTFSTINDQQSHLSTFSTINDQQSHLSTLEPTSDPDYLSIGTENPEMSYGMAILSEAISRQCRELANEHTKKKSPEPDINEIQSSPKKENSTSWSQVPSAKVSPQRVVKKVPRKIHKCTPKLGLQSAKNEIESRIEHEINLLSKRFGIPSNYLRKTVVDEPLTVFQQKYSKVVSPDMVEISPIDVNSKSGLNVNFTSGNIDVEYKLEPIREAAAYEKKNLKDLVLELSKTMPSWSLSIVTNPPRYVISHMSIGMYGVPTANKCIVLDKMFRASVYINQSLEHKLSKRYTTATEIVNLIKEVNSI